MLHCTCYPIIRRYKQLQAMGRQALEQRQQVLIEQLDLFVLNTLSEKDFLPFTKQNLMTVIRLVTAPPFTERTLYGLWYSSRFTRHLERFVRNLPSDPALLNQESNIVLAIQNMMANYLHSDSIVDTKLANTLITLFVPLQIVHARNSFTTPR